MIGAVCLNFPNVRGLVLAGFTQLPPDGSVAASIPAILHDTSAPFRLKESWFQTQSRRSNSKPVPTVSARAGDIVLPNEGNADFSVTHPWPCFTAWRVSHSA